MSLETRWAVDLKAAMKARDAVRVSTLRMLIAEAKALRIDHADATEADVLDVVRRQSKTRLESMETYRAAGREDLALQEEAELAVLQEYLPAPLTEAEVLALAQAIIAEQGATGIQGMSQVMAVLMPALDGRYPGRDASALVRRLLQSGT